MILETKIFFSKHALLQIQERNLVRSDIIEAVITPDKIVHQSPLRFRAVKKIRKIGKLYVLVVICEMKNSTCEIVTAFITSKIKKYL